MADCFSRGAHPEQIVAISSIGPVRKMRILSIIATILVAVVGGAALVGQVDSAELPVRFGAHPTFDRMVFDWREAVEYHVESKDGAAVISFDRAAEVDRQVLISGLAKLSSRAEVENNGQHLVLRLTIPENTQLRHFRVGTKVVFDFNHASGKPTPTRESRSVPGKTVPVTLKPAPPIGEVPGTKASASVTPSTGSPAAPTTRKPIPLRARQEPTKIANAEMPVAASMSPSEPQAVPVAVDLVRTADGMGLRFDWKEPVGAAVFGRGPHLWIVFDRRAALNVASLRGASEQVLGPVQVIEPAAQGQGTILRLTPPSGTGSAARREGDAWVVDIGKRPWGPDVPATISAHGTGAPENSRLAVEMPGARTILLLRDPDIGDEIAVAPTSAAGVGVENERVYPQFRVLATAQGVAIQKLADKVAIRAAGNSVEISNVAGLYLSDSRETAARAVRAFQGPMLFDLLAWRRNGISRFNEDRRALHRAVAEAPNEKRSAVRFDLARFLFAYGNMEDVLGLLRLIEQEDPSILATAQVRAMRGVASLMSGDLEQARHDLNHQSLDAQAEAALWRGALAMAQGDPGKARSQMGRSVDMYRNYPAPFTNRLNLWQAEARILTNDLLGAEAHLDAVMGSEPSLSERAQAIYLRGRLYLASGDKNAAIALWEGLDPTPSTPGRTLAALDRIDLLTEDGKLTPAEAIPILERLRFSWRGDGLELRILARLGHFQIAVKDYRAGLTTLRKALSLYPKHPDAQRTTAEMMDAFAALFTDKDVKVSPVTAIALYDDFRELIPTGTRADQIAQGLADRLIAVDLLDRAGEVLEQLVKTRLTGEEKAKAGAKLAMVRLLDRKPEPALAALKASEVADVSKDTVRERHRLEARALADLGRMGDAMQRISQDDSRETDLLRVELNWRAQDWSAAAAALTRLVGAGGAGELADDKARQAIRLAVALSLSRDKEGLERFDAEFGTAMRRGPYKDIYRVISSDAGAPVNDVRDIAARTAAVAPFQSFLSEYRQRVLAAAPKSDG